MISYRMDMSGFRAIWNRQSPTLRGIQLMCLSTIAFAAMHALVRWVTQDLPPIQVAFFRNLFGLMVLLPLLIQSRFEMLRTTRIGLHAARGVINILAMFLFFTALGLTPLATVTALGFTAPIFMALLSVLFLGERFQLYRWLAIAFGFAGMLIILRPGVIPLDKGAILVTGSAVLWAVAMMQIKILSRTDSSVTIVAYMGIFLCVFSIIPAIWVWTPVSWENLFLMALIGVLGSTAQVSLSQAFKETDPTALMPFDFLKLVWTALIGMVVFAEIPDIYTWIGGAVIFGSGLLIGYREHKKGAGPEKDPAAT